MASGSIWPVKREGRYYCVQVRRRGVEPSGGCLLGFPFWLVTRLRWQISPSRLWSVEVVGPASLRRALLTQRRLLHLTFETKEAAMIAAAEFVDRVGSGEFDQEGPK